MSEEFKCPYCEGTASIAYHRTGNNLLYCKDCKRTFSERDAKIMKQAARIAELEQENRDQLIDYENRLCEARKYQQDSVRRCEELEAERDHFREVAKKLVWLYSDEHQERLDNGLRIDGFYSHEWLGMILDMAREAMKGAGE